MEAFKWIHNDRCLDKVAAMPEPRGGFRFAVLGDVQAGTANLPRLMNALGEPGPVDFIIQTGDISIEPDAGHYVLLMRALANSGLNRPMFVVPGNHDVLEGEYDLFRRYFGPEQFWFEYGGALFIILDNSLGPFTEEQCEWLERVLAEQSGGVQNVFLFMHGQPIYWKEDGRGPVAHLYKGLHEIFLKYEIDYVFSGNWHGYHREERNGTRFIVNGRGGSGSHLAPSFYTIINVNEREISDRCFVLPPRVSILAKSLINDWLIAHVGSFAAANRFVVSVLLLLSGLGSICLVVLARR
jgi:3',5'-cyclic AMP phosphodiesterase CpdA